MKDNREPGAVVVSSSSATSLGRSWGPKTDEQSSQLRVLNAIPAALKLLRHTLAWRAEGNGTRRLLNLISSFPTDQRCQHHPAGETLFAQLPADDCRLRRFGYGIL